MLSLPFLLSISSPRERHLAAISAGVAASLLLPEPGWGVLALLLVPLAMHRQAWGSVVFSRGQADGAINGARWQSHQPSSECLGREVSMAGRIVTLPHEQPLAIGQRRD